MTGGREHTTEAGRRVDGTRPPASLRVFSTWVLATLMATGALFALRPWQALGQMPEALPPRTGHLHTFSETFAQAQLMTLTTSGSRWQTPDGEVTLATDDLLRWRSCPAAVIGPALLLRDGGCLAGTLLAWTDTGVLLASPLLGRLRLPRDAVAAWGTIPLPSGGLGTEAPCVVHLTNGDSLMAAAFAMHEAADSATVTLATIAGENQPPTTFRIPRDRIHTIVVNAPRTSPQAHGDDCPLAIVGLADGTRLHVAAMEPAENGLVVITPVVSGGGRLPPLSLPADAITGLLAVGPHAWPLAWLPVAGYEQTPQLGPAWPLAVGSTLTGAPLAARGLRAFTGLGVHAASRLTYQLPDRQSSDAEQRLIGHVALDDAVGQGGSVVIRVWVGETRDTLRLRWESAIIRGGDAPLMIDVDVSGCQWLELEVDPTGDGDAQDRTLWLEPRLVKRQTSQTARRGPSPAASDASLGTSPGRR